MTVKIAVFVFVSLIFSTMPVYASRLAVIPAYAFVSAYHSSMLAYQHFMEGQNRAAAKQLLNSEKIFRAPRDVRVEVVAFEEKLVKVKLNRLNENAEPVTLYFWTLAEQLKMLPQK